MQPDAGWAAHILSPAGSAPVPSEKSAFGEKKDLMRAERSDLLDVPEMQHPARDALEQSGARKVKA